MEICRRTYGKEQHKKNYLKRAIWKYIKEHMENVYIYRALYKELEVPYQRPRYGLRWQR